MCSETLLLGSSPITLICEQHERYYSSPSQLSLSTKLNTAEVLHTFPNSHTLHLIPLRHHFPLSLCQTKRDPISTWVILDPRSNLPCILPSQECHLFFYLPQTVVFCRYTPTGTQVSWSHYGTLINIHHGYPPGGRLYPQMCLDFHEYQH